MDLPSLSKEQIKRRERYLRDKPHRPSRRRDKEAKCALCRGFLCSPFGTKRRRKYCDFCVKTFGRLIYNAWHRRAYQKRVGKTPDPINIKGIIHLARSTA